MQILPCGVTCASLRNRGITARKMGLLLIVPEENQVSTFALKSIYMTLRSTCTKEDVGIKSYAVASNVSRTETGA